MNNINDNLIEKIFNIENFQEAYIKVKNYLSETVFDGDIEFKRFEEDRDFYILILIEKALKDNFQTYPYIKYKVKKSENDNRIIYDLHFTDQIIIQAIFNIIGPYFDGKLNKNVYGNRIYKESKQFIFKDWRIQYKKIHKDLNYAVKTYSKNEYYYLLKSDIKDFYNSIKISQLIEILKELGIRNHKILDLIEKFFIQTENNKILPAGPAFSHILANIYLNPFDKFLIEKSIEFYRYVDDYWIIFKNNSDISSENENGEIIEFFNEINDFLNSYNLRFHEINTEKTKIYNLKRRKEEILKKLSEKIYGGFIEFHEGIDNKEIETFANFLNFLDKESDSINIDDFLHKNTFTIIKFMENKYNKRQQELIIQQILNIPKINLRKGIILFSILLKLRNVNLTAETYEFLSKSSDSIVLYFLISLKSNIIKDITIQENKIINFLEKIIKNNYNKLLKEIALKKYLEILVINDFFNDREGYKNTLYEITLEKYDLKKIVYYFFNDFVDLLSNEEFNLFLNQINNKDINELSKSEIVEIENFWYILVFHQYWPRFYTNNRSPFPINFNLFCPDFLSSHPLIYAYFLIIFFRIQENRSISIISNIYKENSINVNFKNSIYSESLIFLSKLYSIINYHFLDDEQKKFISFIRNLQNEKLQSILFLNMKNFILNKKLEEKVIIEKITPYVYNFDNILYQNFKLNKKEYKESIISSDFSIQQINEIKKKYEKLFENVLTIELRDNLVFFKYQIPENFQPLRDLLNFEDKDLADKIFLEILCKIFDKFKELDDPDDFCFLNFDNIFYNPNDLEVINIFIAPNLFKKIFYFSLDSESKYYLYSHQPKKIYRILRSLIYENFTREIITSITKDRTQRFYELNKLEDYNNPYLSYIFKRISYESNEFLFNRISDFIVILKKLNQHWEIYKNNRELRNLLEVFDFNIFLLERHAYVLSKEKNTTFYNISALFRYYHKNLLNITILRNYILQYNYDIERNEENLVKFFNYLLPPHREIIQLIEKIENLKPLVHERVLEISSLNIKKFVYFSLYYSLFELFFKALYYIGLKEGIIQFLKIADINGIEKRLDELIEREKLSIKIEDLNINNLKIVLEKLDPNEFEINNFIKEIPIKPFIIIVILLYLYGDEIKPKSFLNQILFKFRAFINQKLFRYRPFLNQILLNEILNFFDAENNLINLPFISQINKICSYENNFQFFANNLNFLLKKFLPILRNIKNRRINYIQKRTYFSFDKKHNVKRWFFFHDEFFDKDLPLINLFPEKLVKYKKLYQFKLKTKKISKPILYHYPISYICYNYKEDKFKNLIWEDIIFNLNRKIKEYKQGDIVKLDHMMQEFNIDNKEDFQIILTNLIKKKKIYRKIKYVLNDSIIIKDKISHRIFKYIIETIIGGIIIQIILKLLGI